MTIKLGHFAQDKASGFTGLVTQRIDQFGGNVQFVLSPRVKEDGTYPEAMQMDQHNLVAVKAPVGAEEVEVTPPPKKFDWVLGNTVKDVVSGFVGIAIESATHMNGCVSFQVVPKHNANPQMFQEQVPAGSWISSKRLAYEGEGVVPPVAKTPRAPGGPSMRVARPIARKG